MRTLLVLTTLTGGLLIFIPSLDSTAIGLREDESWQLVEGTEEVNGALTSGSYRSLLLIVVAIKTSQGKVHHAVVWRDALSPTDFSALHIRLALTPRHQLL